jgi:hypothetical protein
MDTRAKELAEARQKSKVEFEKNRNKIKLFIEGNIPAVQPPTITIETISEDKKVNSEQQTAPISPSISRVIDTLREVLCDDSDEKIGDVEPHEAAPYSPSISRLIDNLKEIPELYDDEPPLVPPRSPLLSEENDVPPPLPPRSPELVQQVVEETLEQIVEQIVVQPPVESASGKADFEKNQAMVEQILIDDEFQKKMRNVIREFFAVQRTFHEKIDKFVRAFDIILPSLNQEQQEKLEILLKPYCMLIANPFNDLPIGNLEEDLQHIVSVINKRNQHFVRIFPAISMAVKRIDEFSAFISEIQTDKELKQKMLDGINFTTWQDVEGRIMLPTQRVIHCRNLILTIEAVIMKTMDEEVQKLGKTSKGTYLEILGPSIAYLLPTLNYVNNNNLSKITLLEDMDARLNDLLKMEVMLNALGQEFVQQIRQAKYLVDLTIQNINFNVGNVLEHLQNLLEKLQGIKVSAQAMLDQERKKRQEQDDYERQQAYYKQGFYLFSKAVSWTIYGAASYPPGEDPREKFTALIDELDKQIRELKIAYDAVNFFEEHGLLSPVVKRI